VAVRPLRDFAAHQFRRKVFAFSNVLYLFGDDAFARKLHLREISSAAIHRGCTLFNPSIPRKPRDPRIQSHISISRTARIVASLSETSDESAKGFLNLIKAALKLCIRDNDYVQKG